MELFNTEIAKIRDAFASKQVSTPAAFSQEQALQKLSLSLQTPQSRRYFYEHESTYVKQRREHLRRWIFEYLEEFLREPTSNVLHFPFSRYYPDWDEMLTTLLLGLAHNQPITRYGGILHSSKLDSPVAPIKRGLFSENCKLTKTFTNVLHPEEYRIRKEDGLPLSRFLMAPVWDANYILRTPPPPTFVLIWGYSQLDKIRTAEFFQRLWRIKRTNEPIPTVVVIDVLEPEGTKCSDAIELFEEVRNMGWNVKSPVV